MRDLLEQLLRAACEPDPARADALWADYRDRGDEAAFATLLAWHGLAVYRRAWGFLRDHAAAEDAFQAAVGKLHANRARFRLLADALRWWRGVVANEARMILRARRRAAAREAQAAVPEEAAAEGDLQAALREALDRLPDDQREAIALVYFEGLTRQDAAQFLGIHRDTLAKRLDRALGQLRNALGTAGVLGTAGTTVTVEAALAVRAVLPTAARLAGLAAAALSGRHRARAGGWWLQGKAQLLAGAVLGGLVVVLLALSLRSDEMAPALTPKKTARLGVERLEDRTVPTAVGFSTALAGGVAGMAVDAAGNTYVTTGAGTGGGGVYKFDPAGHLLASNPSVSAGGAGIAVDSAGDVYLHHGAVTTELDPTLQNTLFTVTLPGPNTGQGAYGQFSGGTSNYGAVAVAGGKIYVVGTTKAGLPTTPNAAQPTYPGAATGRWNAYLAVIDPSSPAPYHLTYCTYLGGATGHSRGDGASGVAVDAAGVVYVTGSTESTDFPTTPGAFQTTYQGPTDNSCWYAFVTKIDPSQAGAASLVYSTYLGGSAGKTGFVPNDAAATSAGSSPSIAVDAAGNAYVAGSTTATNFPTTAGAFRAAFTPVSTYGSTYQPSHAFVTKLNPAGTGLVYSTLLGGGGGDGASGGIAVDAAGDVWLTGWTRSADFPVTAGAVQPRHSAGAVYTATDRKGNVTGQVLNADAFVAELSADGSGLLYSTYWGGSENDYGMGIGLDAAGDVFVGGLTAAGYPTTPGAYQTSGSGYLLKLTH